MLTQNSPQNLSPNSPQNSFLSSFQSQLKRHWVDGILILFSIVAFAAFTYRAAHVEELSGLATAPIARLVEGVVEKREIQHSGARQVGAGELFFDRDAVWVGPQKKARFRLQSGKEVVISENTTLVFRTPFGFDSDEVEDSVEVIQGEMSAGSKTYRVNSSGGEGGGAAAKVPVKNIYPPDNALFYFRPRVVPEVTFFAGDALVQIAAEKTQGLFHLQNVDRPNEVRFIPLPADGKIKISLALNQHYLWEILTADKRVIAGPFPFEIKSLAPGEESVLIKDSADPTGRPVFTFW